MTLKARIEALIRQGGPLSIPDYVTLCLHDREAGYYASGPSFGADGDFVTAPIVSQMFGELLGLWAVEVWSRLGRPARVILAEVGPGDATLMLDALRAAKVAPDFIAAAEIWLVEPSPALAAVQASRLSPTAHSRESGNPGFLSRSDQPDEKSLDPRIRGDERIKWARTLADLPVDAPLILLANEVLDCIPARQHQRTTDGWAERRVGLDVDGELAFTLGPGAVPHLPDAPVGSIVEHSPAQAAFAAEIAHRVVEQGGVALLIDYGRTRPEPGDTLQAVRRHAKVDPLSTPGQADLTMWAEFDVVGGAVELAGATVHGPISQATFLRRLGIDARAAVLSRARPDQAPVIARQLHRLTAPDQMGSLFKAIAVSHPAAPPPPGFETSA